MATTKFSNLILLSRKAVSKVPHENGVYAFFDVERQPIYIGKSVNLRSRVESYLQLHLLPKTEKMVSMARYFTYIVVQSEIEALLLEANLVKKYQTKFNIELKDGKSPLYIKITKGDYPRVLTARRPELASEPCDYFGPFLNSKAVKQVLWYLRKIFPYSTHKLGSRACLYSQIGLCSPCPNSIEKIVDAKLKDATRIIYLKNIANIKSILRGNIGHVKRVLENEMTVFAKSTDYERATSVKNQIRQLENIVRPADNIDAFIENPNLIDDIRASELRELRSNLKMFHRFPKTITRIECYDIAHLAGNYQTASMVTFIDGRAEKKYYRHFKINQTKRGDDLASLKEAGLRRVKHFADWGTPDLIIVDGGKTQAAVFDAIFRPHGLFVVGLAKREETLVIPHYRNSKYTYQEIKLPPGLPLNLIRRIRDEAHRFARRYHHLLVNKSLLEI